MSNMHILNASGGKFHIALHIAIPAVNNSAGIAYATVLVNSGLGGTTSLTVGDGTKGTITAAEKASIVAGTLVEVIDVIDVTQGGTLTTAPQQATFLNDFYSHRVTEVQNSLAAQLLWYGQVL